MKGFFIAGNSSKTHKQLQHCILLKIACYGTDIGIKGPTNHLVMTTEQNKELLKIRELEQQTLKAIFEARTKTVVKLYEKAEQLFIKGTSFTRLVIANEFIDPLSRLLEMNYSWGKQFLQLLPQQLKAEYRKQLYSTV